MRKMNIICTVIFSAILLGGIGCSKDDTPEASLADKTDWLVVQDLPGEYNQLRYKLYKDYGITLLTTDTLGTQYLGKDEYGMAIYKTMLYQMGYNIFNLSEQEFTLFDDEALNIKTLKAIEKWVCPNLPTARGFSPQVVFIVDSLQFRKFYSKVPNNPMAGSYDFFIGGLRGVTIGNMLTLKDLSIDSDEWRIKMGFILAKKAVEWIFAQEELKEDVTTFKSYAVRPNSPEGILCYDKSDNLIYYSGGKLFDDSFDCRIRSFLRWNCIVKNCEPIPDPIPTKFSFGLATGYYDGVSGDTDVATFISYYYLYKDRMSEFYEINKDFPAIAPKMKLIISLMEKYEKAAGVNN